MPAMADSCVYLDIFTRDPVWHEWSAAALADAANRGSIVINPVIYSEISIRFGQIEELEALLSPDIFEYQPIPREAAFLAGKCFLQYRRSGGRKTLPLPDFFIGAHAAVAGLELITRDPCRFRKCFPGLTLVCP
ncbi:MAG: type II toxin-antitoxin system VapC family toxin [Candidatus Hydrogenedens sp.]|nr:type II toxin-antitoxin system VapC family toxin [Candidatus Hydrogenedentota bacterium]NLF58763.1 type II toxin-antitoxin system VapC family toxin [Candidatus Hydrogenedens sp.]